MLLQMKDVHKQYPQFELDCSLEVTEGRIVGLVGPNGAGKSTAFKIILDLICPDRGEVLLFDKKLDDLSQRERSDLGFVLVESGLSGTLTIKEAANILAEIYPAFEKEAFLEHCQEQKLPLTQETKEFSTGMRAKFKVLAALHQNVKFLLLDEPTSGLDVVARREIMELLRDFMEEENRGILISSHIFSDLEGLCDELYLIDQGQIILHQDMGELLDSYGVLKADEKQFSLLDKEAVIRVKKENYGYSCLCTERQFYMENYPGLIVEKGTLDEIFDLMIRGEKI